MAICTKIVQKFGKKSEKMKKSVFWSKKNVSIIGNLENSFRAFLCISFFLRFFRKVFEQPKNGHGPSMSKNGSTKIVSELFIFFSFHNL